MQTGWALHKCDGRVFEDKLNLQRERETEKNITCRRKEKKKKKYLKKFFLNMRKLSLALENAR